jgi:putative transposase
LVETDGTQAQHRAHTARLYPSPAQLQKLDRQGHTARALWNLLHEWHGWGGPGGSIAKRPSPREMDRQLRDARSHPLPGWEWLAQLPAQASQQVLRQYLRAWDRHYKRVSGPPRFKHRTARMAIDLPQAADLRVVRVNRRWGEVTVLLVGRVRFRWTRPLPVTPEACRGRITGGRLVKDPLGWHICFRIQEPAVAVARRDTPAVGIDLGVVHTMALSDGQNLDMPNLLSDGEARRLRALQRKAARKRRAQRPGALPSQREREAYRQVVALRARQTRRRTDWIHKATTRVARSYGTIVVEDLNIAGMTRSARGTTACPGRNVKAKAGLNGAILGMAWGRAQLFMAYKAAAQGGRLVRVAAPFSSQTCAKLRSRRAREPEESRPLPLRDLRI